VILLDIGLPDMEGYEVARQIRQEKQREEILLVALTGYGEEETQRRSQEAGFDYHFTKPVDFDALKKVLNVQKIFPRDTGLTPEF
jgi:CheY-like chemotaxis protein